jgi:tripartite motif-containing protein 71
MASVHYLWGDAQFSYPSDAAVDSSHDVYVVDHFNFRIQKFDANGNFITKWGSLGTGDGQFRTPFGIAIDSSDNVYVTDFLNHRIQKFTRAGEFVTKWGSQGTGDGEFRNPRGIAVDSDNNVYVVDGTNQRVQKFDSNGDFKSKWGSFCPVGPGTDERCIDPDGSGPSVAGDGAHSITNRASTFCILKWGITGNDSMMRIVIQLDSELDGV